MSKLTGKVAVVTGASKGTGAAIAKSLAAEGASVVVNYASSKAGADTVVTAIKAADGNAVAVPVASHLRTARFTPARRPRSTPSPSCCPASSARRRSGSIPSVPAWSRLKAPTAAASSDLISRRPPSRILRSGRIGRPGDIASIAIFLASEDSAWLTGERLLASAGLRSSASNCLVGGCNFQRPRIRT